MMLWVIDPAKLRPPPGETFPPVDWRWVNHLDATGQPRAVVTTSDRYVLTGAHKVQAALALKWPQLVCIILPEKLSQLSADELADIKGKAAKYYEAPIEVA